MFGHTHAPFCERLDGVLPVNPGGAGKRRLDTVRSVAVLAGEGNELRVDFHPLREHP